MFDKVVKAAPFPPPYWWRFTIDGRVLVFTLAITLVATIVSGLLPAFLSSRGNAAEVMKEGGRGNSSRLVNVITRVLVVGQIALTAALLIAATLQIKSIRNQTKLDYGYDENGLYAARLALMEGHLSERRIAPRILHARGSRAAHQSAVRSRGHDRSLPHDLRAGRAI